MSTRLFRDGFQIDRFYAQDLGAFYDEVGSMIGLQHEIEDLKHHDCKHQLLWGVDGRFIRMFGSLERMKGKLDKEGYEQLSMDICKAYYLFKREDLDGFAQTINGMDDVLHASVQRRKTANDA